MGVEMLLFTENGSGETQPAPVSSSPHSQERLRLCCCACGSGQRGEALAGMWAQGQRQTAAVTAAAAERPKCLLNCKHLGHRVDVLGFFLELKAAVLKAMSTRLFHTQSQWFMTETW